MDGFSRAQEITAAVAQCGRGQRGVSRIALTEPDMEARRIVRAEMESLGMDVRLDACGNMWGKREGTEDGPGVVIGSHLDSVPEGGDYDGVLGVAAGLGVVRDIIMSNSTHRRSLSVAVFTAEESSRFSLACIGSKAATGNLTLADTLRFKDREGVTLLNAIRSAGGCPERIPRDRIAPVSYEAYFELHIEQGPVLDWSGEDVGIVDAIAAPTRFALELNGTAAHSGACPMNMRHDALAAAAAVILAVESAGRDESENGSVATVGVCECSPGVMNVVPGRALLKVDIRGVQSASIARVRDTVLSKTASICASRGVQWRMIPYSADEPVVMDGLLARKLERICRRRGIKYRRMSSGAGHDAMFMASLIPSALIFVPCADGVSHNPDERVDWAKVRSGYDVLLEAVRDMVV
ncbi:MAG: M20 family metallo-hydrolase [Pyramidobacter sp.]|nr:M20 family metallo-hydrolase [Pyramidobacter sp.]